MQQDERDSNLLSTRPIPSILVQAPRVYPVYSMLATI